MNPSSRQSTVDSRQSQVVGRQTPVVSCQSVLVFLAALFHREHRVARDVPWSLSALVFLGAFTLLAAASMAQQPPPSTPPQQSAPATDEEKKDEGIAVTSDLVRQKCSSCHKADDKGRLTRISFMRTTPEGWQDIIKRMVTLNDVKIEPSEARQVLRYLSDRHGLAPEEAQPAAFEVERRNIDYKYTADKDTESTCIACHSIGRVISQRRTKEEWELLIAMHRGYYPLVDFQAFRRGGPPPRDQAPGPDGRPPDNRHPMDKAIAHLSTAFPFTTPEWSAWAATMRPPQLEGRWALSAHQIGKGRVFGQVTITPLGGAESGEFTTQTSYMIPRTGEKVTRTGKAIVYTGYQWRGRSSATTTGTEQGLGGPSQPDRGAATSVNGVWREVMFIDRDWRRASGRWFTGAYDEFGLDVKLQRIGADPIVLGVAETRVGVGGPAQELHLYGANLPTRVSPADLNFGPGITVDRVVSAPDSLVVTVSVAGSATPGSRAVFLRGATGDAAVAVYSTIDFVKVMPQAGLSRVGGANFPKQFEQFEAIAVANGPDGKPNSKDDIDLGLIGASWELEEYTATYDDDDKDFVGTIDSSTGLFTPNVDGPNPKRKHNTNNYGDVWVVASVQAGNQPTARTIKARAHLLVTVPLYIKWDQPEVGR